LAEERGAYMHFVGSEWSKGKVPFDTIAKVEADRGVLLTVDKTSHHRGLNWDILRTKVKKGMRNSTLMAVAPTANIGLVAGVTPGIDVRFAQIFSRNKFSGKYVDINHNLVKDLMNLGIWDNVKDLIIEYQGDISEIPGIPQHIKDVYKTSFSTSPYAVIEIAARAQKWVDQGLSRNMYLETRDIDETMKIYKTAWEKGVKTTYYLHMKPRHTAEQSTVAVNKAQKIGKIGFGALGLEKKFTTASSTAGFSAPLQKSLEVSVTEPTPNYTELTPKAEDKLESVVSPINVSVPSDIKIEEKVVVEVASVLETEPVALRGFAMMSTTNAETGTKLTEEKLQQESIPQMEGDVMKTKDGKPFVCPIDPDELAACESCQ
jgi:ribonucleoside-diphosphate reductase alpha chain